MYVSSKMKKRGCNLLKEPYLPAYKESLVAVRTALGIDPLQLND